MSQQTLSCPPSINSKRTRQGKLAPLFLDSNSDSKNGGQALRDTLSTLMNARPKNFDGIKISHVMLFVLMMSIIFYIIRSFGVESLIFLAAIIAAAVFLKINFFINKGRLCIFAISNIIYIYIIISIDIYFLDIGGNIVMVLLLIFCSSVLIPYGFSCVSPYKKFLWAYIVAVSFMPVTIVAEHWPLRFAFCISKNEVNSIEKKYKSGSHIKFPCDAGIFRIEKCILNNDKTCIVLLLDDDLAGRTGFVKYDPSFQRANSVMKNLNYNIKMYDGWYYQNED
jgi:hypothetical protein